MVLGGIEIYLLLEGKAGDDPLIGSCIVQMGAKREKTSKIKRLIYEKKEMLQIGEPWKRYDSVLLKIIPASIFLPLLKAKKMAVFINRTKHPKRPV